MNKILNINLGGYALTMDEDAYEFLAAYLDSLKRRFAESADCDEILRDIETRMGELISAGLGVRAIVTVDDIEDAISIMGRPEDFGAEPIEASRSKGRGSERATQKTEPRRRLFRDPEEKVAGGVCSGIAAYFGLVDPVWIRLAFVLLSILSGGFWITAYVVLWMIIPEAQTASDRLAMRGEPINAENIAKEVEEGLKDLGKRANELGGELSQKHGTQIGSAVNQALNALGSAFGFVARLIGRAGAGFLVLVGLILLVSLLFTWISGVFSFVALGPMVHVFSPLEPAWNYLGMVNLFFVFGVPLLGLILVMARAVFKYRSPLWLSAGLGGLWFANLLSLLILGGMGIRGFSDEVNIRRQFDLSGVQGDTLRVRYADDEFRFLFDGRGRAKGRVKRGDRIMLPLGSTIMVTRAPGPAFRAEGKVSARGYDDEDAQRNADAVAFDLRMENGKLAVPKGFVLEPGAKWRNQQLRLEIAVPVGKYILFEEEIYRNAKANMSEYAKGARKRYLSKSPGTVFFMSPEGLIAADLYGDKSADMSWEDADDFDPVEFLFEGPLDIELTHADEYRIRRLGDTDSERLRVNTRGNRLSVSASAGKPVKVQINARMLSKIYADQCVALVIRDFEEDDMRLTVKGDTPLKAYVKARRMTVVANDGARVALVGEAGELSAVLHNKARLEGEAFPSDRAVINATERSEARILVKDGETNAQITRDDGAKVLVIGN